MKMRPIYGISLVVALLLAGYATLSITQPAPVKADQIVIYNGIGYELQQTKIDFATAADHSLAPAVSGYRVVVLFIGFVCTGGANTVTMENIADDSDITGAMGFAQYGGWAPACGQWGCFETDIGSGLEMELSAATSVDGVIRYIYVP